MLIWIVGVILFGYIVGCMHGSSVAQKYSGISLKESGSKNAGASNAAVVLGKKFGALVAFIDISKGAIAVIVVRISGQLAGIPEKQLFVLLLLVGIAAILGHNYPFHMGFNGGKGTATIIGVLLAIDWRFGLVGFALFVSFALVTNYIVFGVFMLYFTFLALAICSGIKTAMAIALLLLLVGIVKHLENFSRIKDGSETHVSAIFQKKTKK